MYNQYKYMVKHGFLLLKSFKYYSKLSIGLYAKLMIIKINLMKIIQKKNVGILMIFKINLNYNYENV